MSVNVNQTVELPINIFSLIDSSDFVTMKTSVPFNAAGLLLWWNFLTVAGVYTQTAVVPTTGGGDYDWVEKSGAMYSITVPASGGVSANNDTPGTGWFTGVADGVLPWTGPKLTISPAQVNTALITGTSNLPTNVSEINGNTPAAGNLATFANGDPLGLITRALGLTQENSYIDNTSYSAGNLVSARIRTYTDAASVGTASNVLATYTLTATYSGSQMLTYSLVKQ